MRWLDRKLRDWRGAEAAAHVPDGSDVLDIGGFDGHFLGRLKHRIRTGVCVDPLAPTAGCENIRFLPLRAAGELPFPSGSFDVVVMLATFEHLGHLSQAVASDAFRVLRPGGRLVLTVPSPSVDPILSLLSVLRVIDGMSLEEHHGFDSGETLAQCEAAGFRLVRWSRFQFRLNNLFVFEKPSGSGQ